MNDDAALLRAYSAEGSQTAFAEFVRRHVDLVYGAALRRTGGDAHRAAEVAQQVFTTAARQAGALARHPMLPAWLHTATRNAALNLMISEQRRKLREQKAAALEPPGEPHAAPDWETLRPVIDAAIDELPEQDRGAIVLRFFEQRPFAHLAAAFRVSEDAARRRTERALEKLRVALARRGITSTGAALGLVVANHPLLSAPAGLAATLASTAIAGAGAATGGMFLTVASFMTAKTVTTAALSAFIAFGIGAYIGFDRATVAPLPPPPETPQHTLTIASLRKENTSLRAEVAGLNAKLVSLAAERATPPPAPAPVRAATPAPAAAVPEIERVNKQRAMLNNLRQIAAARDQFDLEHGRPPASLDELVGEKKYIRRLNPADGEDYSALTGSLVRGAMLTVSSPNGVSVTYDPAGRQTTRAEMPPPPPHIAELGQRLQPTIDRALAAYQAANNGAKPPNSEAGARALLPYFSTPQEGADFVEYLEAVKQAGFLK